MDYDRIILELLDRIKTLEDEVNALKEKVGNVENNTSNEVQVTPIISKPQRGTYTDQVKEFINNKLIKAKNEGFTSVILIASDIAKGINLKNRFPLICNAMRSSDFKYEVVYETPSGYSSTLKIKYYID